MGKHPIEGVLDQLIARERGTRPAKAPTHSRRMLVLAALGPGEGAEARATIARQALQFGRRPAAIDIACEASPLDAHGAAGHAIPLASIPCGPERLRGEPAEVVGALLQRLRRHEAAADLLIVRIPPVHRMALMRAAFLAGGLIVPLEDSHEVLHEALRLSREAAENFMELPVWPQARDAGTLDRYQAMTKDFLQRETKPFNANAEALENLNSAPEEGFLAAMLAAGSSKPPTRLLQLTSLTI
jgi:hypothetical protein